MPKSTNTPNRNYKEDLKKAIEDGTLKEWAQAGATNDQIADYLNIGRSTFYRAISNMRDLRDALYEARKPVVPQSYGKLIKLAHGFHYDETEDEYKEVLDRNGNIVELHTRKVKHLYSKPDAGALSRIIATYTKRDNDGVDSYPAQLMKEPEDPRQEAKHGRLPELEQALQELFFPTKQEQED